MYNYSNCDADNYVIPNMNQNNYQMQPQMNNQNTNILNSSEGFIRGNMFSNLYQPYLAREPFNLNPRDEQEASLDKIRELGFATIDLGLYLDTHPEDNEVLRLFNQYRMQDNQLTADYEQRYGPLSRRSDALNAYPWAWINSPWPWEVK